MPVESPIPPRKNYSDLVAAYALRLHAAAGDQHHIISPLGAWLVLALAAPLVTSGEREALERVLGCDVDTARRAADEMLVDPHPAVEMALAMWHRGDIGPALDAWGRSLPACATTGPVPTQAKVDAWAQEKSKGQIESMPVALDEFTRLLLATRHTDDPAITRLLQDLEFVLMQLSQYAVDGRREDLDAINQSLDKHNVMPKLRSTIPAGVSASAGT